MPGLPSRGCDFMPIAQTSGFRTRLTVSTTFSSSEMTIRRNLAAEEYEGMPDDERIASAELLSFTVIPDATVSRNSGTTAVYLNMSVKINSVAGTNHTVILPVETLP